MKRVLLWTIALAAAISLSACAQKSDEQKQGKAPETQKQEEAKQAPVPAPETPTGEEAPAPAAPDESTADKSAPQAAVEPAAPATPSFDLVGTIAAVEKFIPDSPIVVAAADIANLDTMLLELLGGDILLLPEDQMKALQETLRAYHLDKLGVTLRGVSGAVAFVGPTGDIGVIAKADIEFADRMRGEEVNGYRLLKLVPDPKVSVFEIPDYGIGVYVPAVVKLDTYLQLVNERTAPNPERLKDFTDMLGRDKAAWFAVAINFTHPIVAAAWPPDVPFKRPNKGLIQLTAHGLAVEIEADTEVLDSIGNLVAMARTKGRAAIDEGKAQLDSLPVPEGSAIILADAYFDVLFERLGPKRDGNKMRIEVTMALWGATPVIGVLAAVAIPAFLKYTKKAKSSEAAMHLEMIRRGAADYFCSPHLDAEGNVLANQFPADVGLTPEQGCCAAFGGPDADGDDSCDADPQRFTAETWAALRFQPTEKHRYAYQFTSNGKSGSEAEFTASAYGDLDCDGERSTFQITGYGVVEDGECDVKFSPIYMENELE